MTLGNTTGFIPLWRVLVTPIGGEPQDVSWYVNDGGQGGSVIDIQDSTTDRSGTFTVQLWDHENKGLLTQFDIGDQVQIWSDTKESANVTQATAEVNTSGVSLPVKAWVSCSSTSVQTSTSMDGLNWTPFVAVGADGSIKSPTYRWIRVDSGTATVTYVEMPLRITGIVNQTQTQQDGPNVQMIQLSGLDFSAKLLNVQVNKAYQNQTPDYIIKDMLSYYFPDITTHNVQSGAPQINYVQFFQITGFDAMGQLATITGWDWYVDANKDMHWFPASSNPSGMTFSSTGTDANIVRGSASFTHDGTKLVNKVTFYGGSYLSANRTETRAGDGQTQTFFTTYPIAAAPNVYENGTEQPVGQDGIDLNMDWYYTKGKNYVTQSSGSTPLKSTDVFEIVYQYNVPLIEQGQVDTSIQKYGLFEGSLNDSSVTDRTQARAMINGQLQQYAYPLIYGTFDTVDPTIASGEMATVNVPDQGVVNQSQKVTQVHHQIQASLYQCTVTTQGQVSG